MIQENIVYWMNSKKQNYICIQIFLVTRRVKKNYQNFKLSLGENYVSLFFFLIFLYLKNVIK